MVCQLQDTGHSIEVATSERNGRQTFNRCEAYGFYYGDRTGFNMASNTMQDIAEMHAYHVASDVGDGPNKQNKGAKPTAVSLPGKIAFVLVSVAKNGPSQPDADRFSCLHRPAKAGKTKTKHGINFRSSAVQRSVLRNMLTHLSNGVRVRSLWVEGAIHVLAHVRVGHAPQRVHSDQNSTLTSRAVGTVAGRERGKAKEGGHW